MPPRTRRIAVAAEPLLLRQAISALLNQTADLRVVSTASSEAELLAHLANTTVDIVLLYYRAAAEEQFSHIETLCRYHPAVPIIILTEEQEGHRARSDLADFTNVRAYVATSAQPTLLYETIRVSCITAVIITASRAKGAFTSGDLLRKMTRQELSILRVMAAGLSNEEISRRLHISVRTVEGHRSNIYLKTGARNLAVLIRYALRYGIVTLDDLEQLSGDLK